MSIVLIKHNNNQYSSAHWTPSTGADPEGLRGLKPIPVDVVQLNANDVIMRFIQSLPPCLFCNSIIEYFGVFKFLTFMYFFSLG